MDWTINWKISQYTKVLPDEIMCGFALGTHIAMLFNTHWFNTHWQHKIWSENKWMRIVTGCTKMLEKSDQTQILLYINLDCFLFPYSPSKHKIWEDFLSKDALAARIQSKNIMNASFALGSKENADGTLLSEITACSLANPLCHVCVVLKDVTHTILTISNL